MPGLNTRDGYVIFGLVESEIGVFHVFENKSEDKAGDCEQAGNSSRSPKGIYLKDQSKTLTLMQGSI